MKPYPFAQAVLNRRRFLQITGGVTVATLAGCLAPGEIAPTTSRDDASIRTPQRGGTLRVAFPGAALQLDPAFLGSYEEFQIMLAAYDRLINLDDRLTAQPALATAWHVASDGLSWDFELRQGVTFHHGLPFTAKDVVYTFERIFDPTLASPVAAVISFVDHVEAVDEFTARFYLKLPNADLPVWLAGPDFAISAHDRGTEALQTAASGTGPFRLTDFVSGDHAHFVRNESYWQADLPYVNELHFLYIPESATQVAALLSGEIDVMWQLGFENIAALEAAENVQLFETPGGGTNPIVMRVTEEPFTDVRVRQALKHCVDRAGMRQVVLQGRGELGNDQSIPPVSSFWAEIEPLPYDLEKAKALLTEAGYADGLDLTLVTSTVRPGMVESAVAFQEMVKQAGINIAIEMAPAASYWDTVWLQAPFSMSNWGLLATADEILSQQEHSTSEWNESAFSDPRVDAAIEAARSENDPTKRYEYYAQAQEIIVNEGGRIIPYFRPALSAARSNVNGLTPSPLELMHFYSVWLA